MTYEELKALAAQDELCVYCGKKKDHHKHIRYGNDLDNPVKHAFTPDGYSRLRQLNNHRAQHFDEVLEALEELARVTDSLAETANLNLADETLTKARQALERARKVDNP